MTESEYKDRAKARAIAEAATVTTFKTALDAAQALMVTAAAAVAADGGAAGGTKTATAAAATAIAALDLSGVCGLCSY